MRKFTIGATFLALAAVGPMAAVAQQPEAASASVPIDRTILHAQVILDRLGFSSGILDGREDQSFTAALKGFQATRGMAVTGKLDAATLRALHPFRALRPTRTLAIGREVMQGPFVRDFPDNPAEQAKLDSLAYRSPVEKLAEMFHTTPEVLIALNGPRARVGVGAKVVLPNALPSSRDYPADLPEAWRKTLNMLNVDASQPKGDRVVVDKSDGVLRVYSGDRLVAQFPASMGSTRDPLPIGKWKIQGKSYNPEFHYNPELFWDVSDSKKDHLLPPGPNGPVGVVWLDLSKEHYGIHGTPEPQNIGRTQSHGCIRLTNWDAARLSLMVEPGTEAVFQE